MALPRRKLNTAGVVLRDKRRHNTTNEVIQSNRFTSPRDIDSAGSDNISRAPTGTLPGSMLRPTRVVSTDITIGGLFRLNPRAITPSSSRIPGEMLTAVGSRKRIAQ